MCTQEEDAKLLVRDAISAGIMNDLGSGSNVDLCVIRKNGAEYIRPFESSNYKSERLQAVLIQFILPSLSVVNED